MLLTKGVTKDFAATADQIQKLAEQTNQSSKEIGDTTRTLMEDSAKAVEIMQQMQDVITSQNASVQDTQNIVTEVLDGISKSVKSIYLIKGSTKHLEISCNEVVQSVGELSEIAQDNASSTRHILDAT